MRRTVIFKPQALAHLRWLSVREQRMVTDGVRTHLLENDPARKTRNTFPLHTASAAADYALRLEDLRAFYRIEERNAKSVVSITVVGRKRGNVLIVEGKEYPL